MSEIPYIIYIFYCEYHCESACDIPASLQAYRNNINSFTFYSQILHCKSVISIGYTQGNNSFNLHIGIYEYRYYMKLKRNRRHKAEDKICIITCKSFRTASQRAFLAAQIKGVLPIYTHSNIIKCGKLIKNASNSRSVYSHSLMVDKTTHSLLKAPHPVFTW